MVEQFTFNGITGEVRRATVRDDLHKEIIQQRLMEDVPDGEIGYWPLFAGLVSQTVNAKGLPFDPAALVTASKADLTAAYEWFMKQDRGLKDVWSAARNKVDRPIDPALAAQLPASADPN